MKARKFAQPRSDEVGRKFVGNIPVSRAVHESVYGQLWRNIQGVKDSKKRVVEFAKKAAYLLFEPEEIVGHNVGGLNGMSCLCETKLRAIASKLDKLFHGTLSTMAPSVRVEFLPHQVVTGVNQYLRSARSNHRKCFCCLVFFVFNAGILIEVSFSSPLALFAKMLLVVCSDFSFLIWVWK